MYSYRKHSVFSVQKDIFAAIGRPTSLIMQHLKYISLCLLLGTLLLTACQSNNDVPKSILDFNPKTNQDLLISAHRGGKGLADYPENCLETLQFLHKKGVRIFEIDIATTKDDQLVLMHDKSLERTSTGQGTVREKTLEELQQLQLKDDNGQVQAYKIPTLEAVLAWAKSANAYLTLDLKGIHIPSLVHAIRQQKAEANCALIAYSVKQSKELYRAAPDLMLSVPMRNLKEVKKMLQTNIPTRNMIAFTGTRQSEEGLYERLQELGIMAIFGTLGNVDRQAAARGNNVYHKLMDKGVQIFATDRPLAVQEAIATYYKE